jgi:hypothetical protein
MTTPQIPGLPVSSAMGTQILLNRYRSNQQAIAARVALAVANLWNRFINPASFNDSWNQLEPLLTGIVTSYYNATAADAAQYYSASRVVAGNNYLNVPGQLPDEAYINKVLNIMGPGQFYHYLKDNPEDNAATMAADGLRGSATRLVMAGGRDTITATTPQDPVAKGWERVIEPGACSFCAMLASRGAVYKESTVDFRAHDHCHCVARAVFEGQKSVNQDLSQEWAKVTAGTRGKAAVAAWDQHWSDRNVNTGVNGTAQATTENGAGHAA